MSDRYIKMENNRSIQAAWLKERIERISVLPPQVSTSAYTHKRTPHKEFRVFSPGINVDDFDAGDLVEKALSQVREYAATITEPRLLVWRVFPEFEEDHALQRLKLYLRLAFEHDDYEDNK